MMRLAFAFVLLLTAGRAAADVEIHGPAANSMPPCTFTIWGWATECPDWVNVWQVDDDPDTVDDWWPWHSETGFVYDPASGYWEIKIQLCYQDSNILGNDILVIEIQSGLTGSASLPIKPQTAGCRDGCPPNWRPKAKHTKEPPLAKVKP